MMDSTIMILHDTKTIPPAIERGLSDGPWRIITCPTRQADWRERAEGMGCAVIVIDGGDASGAPKLLQALKTPDENFPVIIVAKSNVIGDAIAAMKAGAMDYFPYPIDFMRLKNSISNAVRLFDLTKRVYLLENQAGFNTSFDDIVGQARAMQEIFGMIQMVGKTGATVLITGESGTGKELVAQAIHRHSSRAKGAFIDINCGAIPRELLENELFGHERGAYTGADKRYIGSCERADGGTLFLDEISEMDPMLQVKLLRFLQERSFTKVGGNESQKVDVRIITATNRNIADEVMQGRFREDLFFRLNVVPIHVPALRERKEDIPLLAGFFLERYAQKNEKIFLDFAPQAMEALVSYDWPGNVRELENVIERAVVLHNDSRVKLNHLPPMIFAMKPRMAAHPQTEPSMAPLDGQKILPLELVEKYAIESALRRCMGNVAETARKLKMGQATLYRKLRQYGLG